MQALLLIASLLAPGLEPTHANSISVSRIEVTEDFIRHELEFQTLSVLEVLPGLDENLDGLLDNGELQRGRAPIRDYLDQHYRFALDGGEPIAAASELSEIHESAPGDVNTLFDLQRISVIRELPLESRWHCIQAFNRGVFDILVATDDPRLMKGSAGAVEEPPPKRKKKGEKKHTENLTHMATAVEPEDLEKVISSHKYVVLDFGAGWCKKCHALEPVCEALASSYAAKDVAFVAVDVDEGVEICEEYQVSNVPHFVVLQAGAKVGEYKGEKKEELEKLVQAHCV